MTELNKDYSKTIIDIYKRIDEITDEQIKILKKIGDIEYKIEEINNKPVI